MREQLSKGGFDAFISEVGNTQLEKLGIAEEIYADYAETGGYAIESVRKYLGNENMTGYLFRCLHCGKYRLYVEAD